MFIKRRDNYYKWSKLNVQQGYRNVLLVNQSEADREKGYVNSMGGCSHNWCLYSVACGLSRP